jgi:hypothetical protein
VSFSAIFNQSSVNSFACWRDMGVELSVGSEILNGFYRFWLNRLQAREIDRLKQGYVWKLRNQFRTKWEHGK